MNLPGKITADANRIVEELDRRNINIFISLAKIGLALVAFILIGTISSGIHVALIQGFHIGIMSVVVQACQALAFISITVLGYHGYRGSRVLYLARHLMADQNKEASDATGN